jgi:hypothetical protein
MAVGSDRPVNPNKSIWLSCNRLKFRIYLHVGNKSIDTSHSIISFNNYINSSLLRPLQANATSLIRTDFRYTEIINYY